MAQLDAERQRRARQYARASRRLWLLSTMLAGAYTLAWLILGWSLALRSWLVVTVLIGMATLRVVESTPSLTV